VGGWFAAEPVLAVLRESALTYRTTEVTTDRTHGKKTA